MKKKTICLITNWYPTEENPFQGAFFREQALALHDYFDFMVVHYRFHYQVIRNGCQTKLYKEEENLKEYQIDLNIPRAVTCLKRFIYHNKFDLEVELSERLADAFKEGINNSFDILYCVSGQFEAGYLKKIAAIYKKPYVVSEHAPIPWPNTVVSEFNKKGIESADLLLLISYDKLRQIMMQNINVPRFAYVGNMVEPDKFTYKPSNSVIKTFIVVGAHVFFKNYPLLIKIMLRLKQITLTPFKLLIVGYGANKGYAENIEILEKIIAESELAQCTEMIPAVEHDYMAELYHRADAFVMTSIQEGLPVSAIEAGCCGLPVFSTCCGGVEDYVTDQIGRIYKIMDSETFAHGLCDFLEGRISFDAKYIRRSIIEKFGKEAFVKNIANAFHSVLEE